MVRFCTIQETEGVIEGSSFIMPHQADLQLILSRSDIVIQHTQCVQEMHMYVYNYLPWLHYLSQVPYRISCRVLSCLTLNTHTTFQRTSLRTHSLHWYRMGSCVVLFSVQLAWYTKWECGHTQQPDSDQRCSFGYAYVVAVGMCSSCKAAFSCWRFVTSPPIFLQILEQNNTFLKMANFMHSVIQIHMCI